MSNTVTPSPHPRECCKYAFQNVSVSLSRSGRRAGSGRASKPFESFHGMGSREERLPNARVARGQYKTASTHPAAMGIENLCPQDRRRRQPPRGRRHRVGAECSHIPIEFPNPRRSKIDDSAQRNRSFDYLNEERVVREGHDPRMTENDRWPFTALSPRDLGAIARGCILNRTGIAHSSTFNHTRASRRSEAPIGHSPRLPPQHSTQ